MVTEKFAKKAFRTLLIAYRDFSIDEYTQLKNENNGFNKEADREILERDMTVIAIFAL